MNQLRSIQWAALIWAALGISAGAREIDAGDLYDLPHADVLILGEVHDNRLHHAHQALAIDATKPNAVVFEMLTDAQARQITPELAASEEALERLLDWNQSGWPDFSMYYPIFSIARDVPMFGADLPRADVRRAVSEGAAAVFGDSAPIFGLDKPLEAPEQALREAGQLIAHCNALPGEMLSGMVEAQRLRDAALARAVLAALAETGGPVAVITGNGHGRTDWGLPHALAQAAPDLGVLSIAQFEAPPEGEVPHDLWLVTDPVQRADPCAAFSNR